MKKVNDMAALDKEKRRKPKPKPPKYTWILSPQGMLCYSDPLGGQTIGRLWEAEYQTAWHDSTLARATKEINSILRKIDESNENPKRRLSFVEFRNRLLLVWAEYDVVGPEDDDDEIARALGLSALEEMEGDE
ncbi:MAG: hypothetical protein HPY61_13865 [Methanotrichaceae archaeon]|nr:hypothetical protein [Methanotrichaceae archaeon]